MVIISGGISAGTSEGDKVQHLNSAEDSQHEAYSYLGGRWHAETLIRDIDSKALDADLAKALVLRGNQLEIRGVEFGKGLHVLHSALDLTFYGCVFGYSVKAMFIGCTFINCAFEEGLAETTFLRCNFRGSSLPSSLPGKQFVECSGLPHRARGFLGWALAYRLPTLPALLGMSAVLSLGVMFFRGSAGELKRELAEFKQLRSVLEEELALATERNSEAEILISDLPSREELLRVADKRMKAVERQYGLMVEEAPLNDRLVTLEERVQDTRGAIEDLEEAYAGSSLVTLPPWQNDYTTLLVSSHENYSDCPSAFLNVADEVIITPKVFSGTFSRTYFADEGKQVVNSPWFWEYLEQERYVDFQIASGVAVFKVDAVHESCFLVHVW